MASNLTLENNSSPLVSILCLCFNHEKYIGKSIGSMIEQVTGFDFEIVIHDDFSQDRSVEIIKKIISDNPKVKIKLIENNQNQYSIGKNLPILNALPHCEGEYVAFCEGDDFWIDCDKLQKQYNALKGSNYSMCFTAAKKYCNEEFAEEFGRHANVIKKFSLSEVILGGGGFMPSPTLFFRKTCMDRLTSSFKNAPVGDYFMQIAASEGGAVYLPDTTAAYRVFSESSWSSTRVKLPSHIILSEASSYVLCFEELKKLYKDHTDVLNQGLSAELSYLSFTLFKKKDYRNSKVLYEKSIKYYEGVNKTQLFLKFATKATNIASLLLAIRERFLK